MPQFLKNETVLLSFSAKWFGLSVVTGVLVGGIVGGFLLLLYACIDAVAALPSWHYALIPVGLAVSVYVIFRFSPEAAGHGTDKVLTALRKRWGKIPASVVPVKIISTIATLATGGVVGTEGPAVQIGGSVMSWFSDKINCGEKERKKLVICGVSAALSAVFGAPVAGAVFGIEVLYVGEMFYKLLMPAVISGIASYGVCLLLGVPYPVAAIAVPPFDIVLLLWSVAAAVFFSFVCIFHVTCFDIVAKIYQKTKAGAFTKILMSSAILMGIAFWSGDLFLGLGTAQFTALCAGEKTLWYAFAIKSFLLAVTLAGGGSGGVLTPTFYVGAAAGALFAQLCGLDTGFFAVLGFAGLVSGCVNTPLSALFLVMEMFGAAIAPYAAPVCVLCYLLSGNRSLYPSQILERPKSDAFVLESTADGIWKIRPKKTFLNAHRERIRKKLLHSREKSV